MTVHNRSARAFSVALVASLALLAGCQASEPLVAPAISKQVNDDGREHTYDTAWQNIRKLNADFQAGVVSGLAEDSLFIASQMDRLESGRAGSLGDRRTAELVEAIAAETAGRSPEAQFYRRVLAATSCTPDGQGFRHRLRPFRQHFLSLRQPPGKMCSRPRRAQVSRMLAHQMAQTGFLAMTAIPMTAVKQLASPTHKVGRHVIPGPSQFVGTPHRIRITGVAVVPYLGRLTSPGCRRAGV